MWDQLFEETGFRATNAQKSILDKIVLNLQDGKRMQILAGPNASGKTIMSCMLALKLRELGYHPVLIQVEKDFPRIFSQNKQYKETLEKLTYEIRDEVSFPPETNVIISDSVLCLFDEATKADISSALSQLDQKPRENWSSAQKAIKTIGVIQDVFQRNNELSIISFETGNSVYDINFSPLIATSSLTCIDIPLTKDQADKGINESVIAYEDFCQKRIQQRTELDQKKMDRAVFDRDARQFQAQKDDILALIRSFEARSSDKAFQEETLSILRSLKRDVGEIKESVDEIKTIVLGLNKSVVDAKAFLEMYREVSADEESSKEDQLISKIAEMLAETVAQKEKELNKNTEYNVLKKALVLGFGEKNWAKMSQDSQRCIATAKFTLVSQVDMVEDLDYSGVCLLVSKALERELATRFVRAYQQYIREKKGTDYTQWPGALLKWRDKQNAFTPIREDEFTLGDVSFIMGIKQDKNQRRNQGNGWFAKFCEERLMPGVAHNAINGKIAFYESKIEYIRQNFRNPSSHKQPVSCDLANRCMQYVIEVEAILRALLNDCSF